MKNILLTKDRLIFHAYENKFEVSKRSKNTFLCNFISISLCKFSFVSFFVCFFSFFFGYILYQADLSKVDSASIFVYFCGNDDTVYQATWETEISVVANIL